MYAPHLFSYSVEFWIASGKILQVPLTARVRIEDCAFKVQFHDNIIAVMKAARRACNKEMTSAVGFAGSEHGLSRASIMRHIVTDAKARQASWFKDTCRQPDFTSIRAVAAMIQPPNARFYDAPAIIASSTETHGAAALQMTQYYPSQDAVEAGSCHGNEAPKSPLVRALYGDRFGNGDIVGGYPHNLPKDRLLDDTIYKAYNMLHGRPYVQIRWISSFTLSPSVQKSCRRLCICSNI